MQMRYASVKSKPRMLRSLISLICKEFVATLPSFSAAWDSFVEDIFERANRKRGYGAGRCAYPEQLNVHILNS